MGDRRKQSGRSPWWLGGGSEQCRYCLGWYAWEVALHCIDCDAPVCPLCVIRYSAEHRVACPACGPSTTEH
jgi:hypothetical protein